MVAFATAGRPPRSTSRSSGIAQCRRARLGRQQLRDRLRGCATCWSSDSILGPEVASVARHSPTSGGTGTASRTGAKGDQIPLAMRVVHLTHDMEAIARRSSPDTQHSTPRASAATARTTRSSRTCSPTHGSVWFEQLDKLDPWDAVLDLEPEPHRTMEGAALDDALTVAADFIDLKSPYRPATAVDARSSPPTPPRRSGCTDDEITTVRRAALVHEFGTTAIPNSILDKRGPLTRAELDRVELHPMFTEQMLRRSPALAVLNPVAVAHHERADGSGYHKGLHGDTTRSRGVASSRRPTSTWGSRPSAPTARLLCRPAANQLRELASTGVLEHDDDRCGARGGRPRRSAA